MSARTRPARLAGLGLLAIALAACGKKAAPDLGPRWDDGARYAYQVTLASKTEMGKGNVLIDFKLVGKLEMFARKAEGGAVRLASRLHDLRVEGSSSGGDTNLAALTRELEQPWFATMKSGRVEEIHIKRGAAAAAAGVQRSLAAALQFTSPGADAPNAPEWTGVEHDATGRYQASYRALPQPGRYGKRKVRYESLLFGVSGMRPGVRLGSAVPNETPEVLGSTGELDVDQGTLRAVRIDDEVSGKLATGAAISSHTTVELTLAARDGAAPPETLAGPPGGDFLKLQPSDPYAPPVPRLQNDAAKMAGWTFEKAVAEIEQLEKTRAAPTAGATHGQEALDAEQNTRAQRMGDAFMALSAIFRRDPATIRRANALIRKDGIVASALVDAISSAGTPVGQAALLELATDAKLSTTLRQAAAGSLIRSDRPSAETVAGLAKQFDDPVIGVFATYGLGTFARKLRTAGEADRSTAISQLLVTRLGAVREQSDKVRVMRGIANSAWLGALPAVRPYLSSPNPFLRAGAVEALRLMDDPEIDGLIAERLRGDKELVARNAALDAATPRPPSPALISAVAEVAAKAPDAQGRMKAVRLLVRWLPAKGGAVRPALEQVANADKEPKVRDEARRALDQRTM